MLVAEACNHVRIPEQCDDIGLVQIPRRYMNTSLAPVASLIHSPDSLCCRCCDLTHFTRLRQLLPEVPLELHHAYGREFVPFSTQSHNALDKAADEQKCKTCPDSEIVDHLFTGSIKSLKQYKLVVHCGACMIDSQKLRARMEDCKEANVPMTNYGLLLAYAACPEAFVRVVAPWGITLPPELGVQSS